MIINCIECGKPNTVNETAENINHFRRNKRDLPLIQNHFPHLTADERELILSCICGECFKSIFIDYVDESEFDNDEPAF